MGNGVWFDSKFDQDPWQDPVVLNHATGTVSSTDGDVYGPVPELEGHDGFVNPVFKREGERAPAAPC